MDNDPLSEFPDARIDLFDVDIEAITKKSAQLIRNKKKTNNGPLVYRAKADRTDSMQTPSAPSRKRVTPDLQSNNSAHFSFSKKSSPFSFPKGLSQSPHFSSSSHRRDDDDDDITSFPSPSPPSPSSTLPSGPSPSSSLPSDDGSGLLSVKELGSPFIDVFSFDYFNPIQSQCFDLTYHTDLSVVVSSPTASGKTTIFELAVLRQYEKQRHDPRKKGKIVYMAPIKALCQQIATEWSKFSQLGLRLAELTGDSDCADFRLLKDIDIILTTPEKWDAVTRRWKDHLWLMGAICIVMIDEVHLLNESRGACLEAVVSRMKTVSSSMKGCPAENLRFVACSATLPNVQDIASWLGVSDQGLKVFGDEWRPVPLQTIVCSYRPAKNDFLFDRNLNFHVFDVIGQYSHGKPSLVFCSTRKGTQQMAQQLVKDSARRSLIRDQQHMNFLFQNSQRLSDKSLIECVKNGIGYHSAGMNFDDRRIIESLFKGGHLTVLCTTTTLAQGVNFPAHLVVVKGTKMYSGGIGFVEHSELTIMQMIGRAGRPQYDDSGIAVIMCEELARPKYEALISHQNNIESSLLDGLHEHVNAEIALGTIQDIGVAIEWLKSTFLFHRIKNNPSHYKFLEDEPVDDQLKKRLISCLTELDKAGLIIQESDGFGIQRTEDGISMASSYIAFETMKQFKEIGSHIELDALLTLLCKAKEFSVLTLRQTERRPLFAMNQNPAIRFPLKGKIKDRESKVLTLIQATLGGLDISDWGLKQDTNTIFNCGPRISRALICFLKNKKYFKALHHTILVSQFFSSKLWENGAQLRQLEKIGPVLSRSLAQNNISTFTDLIQADPRRIEVVCGRNPPFGNEIIQSALSIPRFSIQVESSGYQDGQQEIQLHLHRLHSIPPSNRFNQTLVLVGNDDGDLLFFHKIPNASVSQVTSLTFPCKKPRSFNHQIVVHVMNDRIIGADSKAVFIPEFKSHGLSIPSNSPPIGTQKVKKSGPVSSRQASIPQLFDRQMQRSPEKDLKVPDLDDLSSMDRKTFEECFSEFNPKEHFHHSQQDIKPRSLQNLVNRSRSSVISHQVFSAKHSPQGHVPIPIEVKKPSIVGQKRGLFDERGRYLGDFTSLKPKKRPRVTWKVPSDKLPSRQAANAAVKPTRTGEPKTLALLRDKAAKYVDSNTPVRRLQRFRFQEPSHSNRTLSTVSDSIDSPPIQSVVRPRFPPKGMALPKDRITLFGKCMTMD